jgi:hypothetical protein
MIDIIKNCNKYVSGDIMVPSVEEVNKEYSKRIIDPNYCNVDLRNAKLSEFSSSFANKLYLAVANKSDLIIDCSQSITDTVNLFLKGNKLLVPNKACSDDPAKWYLMEFPGSKYITFGRRVQMDINEDYLFEKLGLKDHRLREEKLEVVRNYHNAMKGGNNSAIRYNQDIIVKDWYNTLMPKYAEMFTEVAHENYWTLAYFEMIPVHGSFFGKIKAADWFFYPFYACIRKMFSKAVPNLTLDIGPPTEVLEKPPYAARVICSVGVFLKYNSSFFGGKITFDRNGKIF